ncbi:hypothetical protein BBOV_I002560 [Babesia bovis T2Bo]|uniref:hypothetical protein n=1 Tax=Babesia bovis T2Bo TaxID=484906 RepID=UPI001C369D65|nr:hypothetical protein BBOV_I002560 [Babesia bovis T2Bo]EDO05338.2 hypothetical protein BBOV_I002560 [Babesia bovis T2Bo]
MLAGRAVCRGSQQRCIVETRRLSSSLAESVNHEVLRICSLWGNREPRVSAGSTRADNDVMLLAARHLGLPDSEHLWNIPPQCGPTKLHNSGYQSRIVYQETVGVGRDGNQNDIWLGHARFRGYLAIALDHRSVDRLYNGSTVDPISAEMRKDHEADTNSDGNAELPDTPEQDTHSTIFVFPYTRNNSEAIVRTLSRYQRSLSESDLLSLIYLCGSTGSSRALRLLGDILGETCRGKETPSAIHRVEEHAWPWMTHEGTKNDVARFSLPLVLDALSCAAIIHYTFHKESVIFDHVASELQKVDSMVKHNINSPTDSLKLLDEAILTRIVHLLVLKRNFSQLNCDHIRAFSDFVCDRLHRIDARSIANISFSLGHSKHLDEFWMFMMAKRIQDNPQEFGPDELTAIMDAYSNACLEDHEFYGTLCQQVCSNFDQYRIQHLAIILRSLARVRVRDELLLSHTLEKLAAQLTQVPHSRDLDKEFGYVVANCLVAAGDLDYSGDCNFDSMWNLLAYRIKQSSFDICAINWLPLAAMTFASRTALQVFMPIWLRHVAHTIQKLRSKTYVLTIQRRHHLVRHVFRLGILPRQLLPRQAQRVLDDICDTEYVSGKVPEEFTPESSTFHLEVCACLRALDVAHQREIRIVPFVMDIVVPPKREYCIKPARICEALRLSDKARSGQIDELSAAGFRLKYTRHSPNHRRRKQEVYVFDKGDG